MQPTNKSGPIYHYALDIVSEYHSFGISQVLHRSIMQNSYRIGLSVHMRAFTYILFYVVDMFHNNEI